MPPELAQPQPTTPSRRIHPRLAVLAATTFVITVSALPLDAYHALGLLTIMLVFVIAAAGVQPSLITRQWLGLLLTIALLAASAALVNPARYRLGLPWTALALASKSTLAVMAMLTLAEILPFQHLLQTIRSLGAPTILVDTLVFMDRYRHVFTAELERMTIARQARTFGPATLPWNQLAGLLGSLVARSLERSARVYDAMLCRGWTGELPPFED